MPVSLFGLRRSSVDGKSPSPVIQATTEPANQVVDDPSPNNTVSQSSTPTNNMSDIQLDAPHTIPSNNLTIDQPNSRLAFDPRSSAFTVPSPTRAGTSTESNNQTTNQSVDHTMTSPNNSNQAVQSFNQNRRTLRHQSISQPANQSSIYFTPSFPSMNRSRSLDFS